MRIFTTMLNQFCLVLVWLYFTHHFLTPKEKGWKRELLSLPVWILYLLITASILWAEPAIKFILSFIVIFLILCFIYELEWKRFFITMAIIYINGFLSDTILSLIIITVLQKPVPEMNATDNLILLPILIIITFVMFDWILKRTRSLASIPDFTLTLILSQLPITLMIIMAFLQKYADTILPLLLIILSAEIAFQILIWKKETNYFNYKQQELMNRKLHSLYEEELRAYLKIKDQEQIYRKLRHDLLNEIALISMMEHRTNNT